MKIQVGARNSLLSRAQVEEVKRELSLFHPEIELVPHWVETMGDKDLETALQEVEHSDFFTRELDQLLAQGVIEAAIHSAKDLPVPLPKGIVLAAMTRGLDPRDALLLKKGETVETLPSGAKIGTSSLRREKEIQNLRSDLRTVSVRGTIERRLALLKAGMIEGLVVAEAALLRLRLDPPRIYLDGKTAEGQGRLAIVCREKDSALQKVFQCLDSSISV
jgi:hydroxymethylbilane synthase